jgi:hypothetical protein
MDSEQIHQNLLNKLHQEHAFWSYDPTRMEEISDDAFIGSVLLYLDIDDIINLFKLYPKRKIQQIWKEKMLSQEPMYHGLNRLYAFLFFDIKNPDRYIRDFKRKYYQSRILM